MFVTLCISLIFCAINLFKKKIIQSLIVSSPNHKQLHLLTNNKYMTLAFRNAQFNTYGRTKQTAIHVLTTAPFLNNVES